MADRVDARRAQRPADVAPLCWDGRRLPRRRQDLQARRRPHDLGRACDRRRRLPHRANAAALPTTGIVDGNAAITADTGLWRQVFGGTWQSAFVVQTLVVTGDTEIDGAANVGAYNFIVGKAIAPFAAYSSGTIVLGASGGPGSFRLAPSAYQSFGYLRTAADGTISRTLTLGSATFPVTVNANAITIHNYNDDSTPSLAQIDYDSGTALWLGDPSLAMVLKASGTIKTDQSFEPFTTSTFGYGLKYNYSSSLGGVTAISWDPAYTYGGSVAPTSIIFGDTGTTYGTGLRNTVRFYGTPYQHVGIVTTSANGTLASLDIAGVTDGWIATKSGSAVVWAAPSGVSTSITVGPADALTSRAPVKAPSTTDATLTTLATITPADNGGGLFVADFVALKSDGSVLFTMTAKAPYTKVSGTVTIGTVTKTTGDSIGTTTGMDVSLVASGGTILCKGTGLAATTFRWGVYPDFPMRTTTA
jgi:hypothetical protein